MQFTFLEKHTISHCMHHSMHLHKKVGSTVLPEDLQTRYEGEQSQKTSFSFAKVCLQEMLCCLYASVFVLNCKDKEITICTAFAVSIIINGIILHTCNYFYILYI